MNLRLRFSYVCLALGWLLSGWQVAEGAKYGLPEKIRRRGWNHGETHGRLTVDMLLLGRTGVKSTNLLFKDIFVDPLFPDVLYGTPVLNATDLDFETSLTGRYDLVLSDGSPFELQFNLFGFPGERKSQAARTAPDITVRLFGAVSQPGPYDDPDTPTDTYTYTAKYESIFGSGEVNLRRRLGPYMTLFSGFRYIALQEDLDFISNVTSSETESEIEIATSGHFTNTDNAFYGLQFGAECTVWTNGRARIDVVGRGGVFLNHLEVGFQPEGYVLDRQSDRSAFAGDLQATLFIPLGPGSLRLGYHIFWVNKAALAPNQLDNFDIFTNTGSFDLTSLTYQGGFVGLEIPF